MKAKKKGKKRAKHYEPKLKIHGSFEKAVKALVSEPKHTYAKKK
ncbi:MAG: hypothetical protein ACLQQ4_11740 [Bacteroidia bacterium]